MTMATKEVTARPILFSGPMVRALLSGSKSETRRVIRNPARLEGLMMSGEEPDWCPYGGPGDQLYVRETFADLRGMGFRQPFAYRADCLTRYYSGGPWVEDGDSERCRRDYGVKWKPSIHMPRAASRLTLGVVGVRAERLQDITEEGARAEGVDAITMRSVPRQATWSRRQDFAQLWNHLNRKRGYSWRSNPWVWVVSFSIERGQGE